jgi:hypothetical protein
MVYTDNKIGPGHYDPQTETIKKKVPGIIIPQTFLDKEDKERGKSVVDKVSENLKVLVTNKGNHVNQLHLHKEDIN